MKKSVLKSLPIFFTALVLLFGCQKNIRDNPLTDSGGSNKDFPPQQLKVFMEVNLVADNSMFSPQLLNPNLVNARNVTFSPSGTAFVSVENMGTSMRFMTDGQPAGSSLTIPFSGGETGHSNPTGQVFNYSSGFLLPNGNPAQIIFACKHGTICGWNSGSTAVQMIANASATSNLGITMANNGINSFIYVANFAQNRIDVYNSQWNLVNMPFTDPNLPADYSPLNVSSLSDGKIYVAYAKKTASGGIETGNGNGYVNVFSPNGVLLQRFASKGKLNAPYGIVKAPALFWGITSVIQNKILVGNTGDGRINVFDESGDYLGQLATQGQTLEVDGLWGMSFPPDGIYNSNYLYFAARPGDGAHGVFGYVKSKTLN